jgi:hypothetical protein
MTQGGKNVREPLSTPVPFARLRPLIGIGGSDLDASLKGLSQALGDFGSQVRIHIHLLQGTDKVDHWEVEGGSAKKAKVRHGRPESADVHVVMRPETWTQIASGQLAPYEALFSGKLRVGGKLELAKSIAQHLSDPAVPSIPPC